jgi:two-component system phosphate regulon sensor histidine kinase PhoR
MPNPKIKKNGKSAIFSVFAYKLNTPISAVKGYLESLIAGDRGEINPSQKEYLFDILENIKKISQFIEVLQEANRAETNQLEMKFNKVNLKAVVEKVLSELNVWIKASNCDIFFESSENLPEILGDPTKIKRVIHDLIVNAVTYKKKKGKVEISLEKKGRKVLFTCKDNGIGVPKKELKNIFSKFYRSQASIEIDPSGTGLDLYIDKAIIKQHGGEIWFSKNKGAGMTFYFSLPTIS